MSKILIFLGMVMAMGAIATSASANPPNQSDITGTNIFNSIAPDFGAYGFDAATLAQAEALSNALDQAYADCLASNEQAGNLPLRFALGSSPGGVCISPQCSEFERLLSETQAFLADLGVDTNAVQSTENRVW